MSSGIGIWSIYLLSGSDISFVIYIDHRAYCAFASERASFVLKQPDIKEWQINAESIIIFIYILSDIEGKVQNSYMSIYYVLCIGLWCGLCLVLPHSGICAIEAGNF